MRRTVLALFALTLLLACAPDAQQEAFTAEPVAPEPPEVVGGVVNAADGVPIVYDVKGGGDTALVFVHCWSCDREFWREQFDVFAESYRVVRMDLPGHGESGADRETWSIAGLAEDVRTVVDELGLERVVLVGHSMGGPVSLFAAPLLGERVVGIACVDTLHDVAMKWDEEMAGPIIAAYEQDFEGTNAQFVPMMFPEGADPELVEWVTARANAADHAAANALMADFPNLDQAAMLQAAGVPVRCVNFDAVLVEGVGHYLLLERPAEFNEKLAAAIADLAGE